MARPLEERAPDSSLEDPTGARLLGLWAGAVVIWWGFAFYPVSAEDDSWIAAAQAACFGSLPGGTPGVQGWIMLLLAPLPLLAALLAAYRAELALALPQLARTRRWRWGAGVLIALLALEGAWAAGRMGREARIAALSFSPTETAALPADYPRGARAVPGFQLLDSRGMAFGDSALRGGPTVLSFAFAHCQTVCPALARTLTEARRRLGTQKVQLALVTLDPWRDTPASLAGLVEQWNLPPDTRLLSGAPQEVCRLLDQLEVARARDLRTGEISHAPVVLVVDRRGRVAYRFNNPPASWIVEAVRRAEAAS